MNVCDNLNDVLSDAQVTSIQTASEKVYVLKDATVNTTTYTIQAQEYEPVTKIETVKVQLVDCSGTLIKPNSLPSLQTTTEI